jgi:hypothetical protein
MGKISAAGFACVKGTISEPRQGPWTAKIELDVDDDTGEIGPEVGKQITLQFYDDDDASTVDFVGAVTRGSLFGGRWIGQLVGGAGGLRKAVAAKYYNNVAAESVISDLLAIAGETLDTEETEASVLSKQLKSWARTKCDVRQALFALTKELGAVWRVGRDGLLLIRLSEEYPTITFPFDELEQSPSQGTSTISPEDLPLVRPGTTFNSQRVAEVTTSWDGGSLRQEIIYEDPDGETGTRPRGAAAQFADAMKRVNEQALNYSQLYPATVVKQTGNELEVDPDDERIKGGGITHVPMRHGIPGLVVTVNPGQRVMIFFEEGRATQPAAALWPDGSSVKAVAFTVDEELTITCPTVNIVGDVNVDGVIVATGEVTAKSGPSQVSLSTHIHPHPMGPTSPPQAGT